MQKYISDFFYYIANSLLKPVVSIAKIKEWIKIEVVSMFPLLP